MTRKAIEYCCAALLVVAASCGLAERVDALEVVVINDHKVTTEQFERWVFQHFRSKTNARKGLQAELALKVDELNRICRLSESQLQKLKLAGRGDMKRFFDTYELAKREFQKKAPNEKRAALVLEEIAPLQSAIQAGLFDRDSVIQRSLVNVLTEEQRAEYVRIQRERRRFRHLAAVELTVHNLDQGVPLQATQREKLIALLVAETKPAKRSGQHDFYTIMYQVAHLAPEKLQAILSETQWKVLQQQVVAAKAMKQWLEQRGGMPIEEDDNEWL